MSHRCYHYLVRQRRRETQERAQFESGVTAQIDSLKGVFKLDMQHMGDHGREDDRAELLLRVRLEEPLPDNISWSQAPMIIKCKLENSVGAHFTSLKRLDPSEC